MPYIIIQALIYTCITYFMMDFEHSAGAHHAAPVQRVCPAAAPICCPAPAARATGDVGHNACVWCAPPAVKWLWYTLLTLLTLLYYTYYGLLAVVLSPNLQVSSVASTLFYAIWCVPLGPATHTRVLA